MKLGVLFLTFASALMLSAQGNSSRTTHGAWERYLHSKGGAAAVGAPVRGAPVRMPEPSAAIELAAGVVALAVVALWLRRSGDPFKTHRS